MTTLSPPSVTFKTADINEAAVLRAARYAFHRAILEENIIVFEFEDPLSDALDTLSKHQAGKLTARTNELIDATRWARDVIFQTRRRYGLERGGRRS